MEDPSSGRSAVKVVVRVRECTAVAPSFSVGADARSVTIRQQKTDLTDGKPKDEHELQQFTCDSVLNNASQERTFDIVGKQATDAVLAGYNGTVLCYGQTGAGKSFTMIGSRDQYHQRGVAARCIAHAFREAANRPADEFVFRFSCLEIYNDQMYDLLSTLPHDGPRHELSLQEIRGRVEIKGLLNPEVETEEAALQLLFTAEANRAVAQHQLNVVSSRSHVLYMLACEKRSKVSPGAVMSSKLTLVDLAGSERLKKSAGYEGGDPASAKQLAKEAMSINKSLSFLEQVVVTLGSRKGHVPHRSSRLTAVLRESLGGNCKTLLVANVWPEQRHMEETISTLKFAARMQMVTNMSAINSTAEVTPQAALAACQQQVADLKRELAMHDQLAGRAHISYDTYTPQQRGELKAKCEIFLDGQTAEMETTTLRQVKESFELMRDLYKEQAAALRAATDAATAAQASAAARPPPTSRMSKESFGGGAADELDVQGVVEAQPPVEVVDFVGGAGEYGNGEGGIALGVAPDDAKPTDPQWRQPESRGATAMAPMAAAEAQLPMSSAPAAPAATAADFFFTDFKRGAGKELHALLLDNKRTLRERKSAVRKFGLEVNTAKRTIDDVSVMLEHKKHSSDVKGVTETHHNGVKVIDDEEFTLLSRLKAAKATYREAFNKLTDERSTVEYVASATEQCRQQLLADFTRWMVLEHPEHAASNATLQTAALLGEGGAPAAAGITSSIYGANKMGSSTYNDASSIAGGLGGARGTVSFGGASGMGNGAGGVGVDAHGDVVDQDEQFDELETQLALQKDPDSLPFFKASKLARARKTDAGAVVRAKRPPGFVL